MRMKMYLSVVSLVCNNGGVIEKDLHGYIVDDKDNFVVLQGEKFGDSSVELIEGRKAKAIVMDTVQFRQSRNQ